MDEASVVITIRHQSALPTGQPTVPVKVGLNRWQRPITVIVETITKLKGPHKCSRIPGLTVLAIFAAVTVSVVGRHKPVTVNVELVVTSLGQSRGPGRIAVIAVAITGAHAISV